MLGFARNIVFFRVNGDSTAEKTRIVRGTSQGVIAVAWKCSGIVRAMELMVSGDFFSSLLTLCFCVLHVLKHFLHWNRCVQRMFSRVVRCHSFALCNSASADLSGMAASRFLLAAAACEILLRFAAASHESHCYGSVRRVNCALAAIFSILAGIIFLLKIILKSALKSLFFRFGVEM